VASGGGIELAPAWWKKARPDGLGGAAEKFADALEAHARARKALAARPDARRIAAAEAALDALEDAGRAVAAEAKAGAKAARDKADATALKQTAAAMGRPLARALAEAREVLGELAEAAEAGEFGEAEAHAAYLRRLAPRLRRHSFNFALAVPSSDPAEIRIMLDRKKAGRTLMGRLRKATGARRLTFGVAGMQGLAQELGHHDVAARTLVLKVEGRQIPGLAKRVRLMMRAMKLSQFARVRVIGEGIEEDATEDGAAEEGLEELGVAGGEARGGQRAAPPAIASELRRRLSAVATRAKGAPAARLRAIRAGMEKAARCIARRRFDAATAIVAALEDELDRIEAGDARAARGRRRTAERRLAALARRIGGLGDGAGARPLGAQARAAHALVRAGDVDAAEAALDRLETALAGAEAAQRPTA
jgi:hypothetical protein